MNRTETYTVARHAFALQMDVASPLWKCLGVYEPFRVKSVDEMGEIFTLTVSNGEDETDLKALTSLGHFDSDGAYMELFITETDGRMFRIHSHDEPATQGSRLYISPDYRQAALHFRADAGEGSRVFGITNALMLLYAFTTATRGTLLMHASVVTNQGKAYLFLGRSGTGKSTHSRLWLQHIADSTLLNDDNPVIRIAADGTPIIYGSPWSGKTPCYLNAEAPLGAIVRLSQAPQNCIARQKGVAAYAAVAPSLSAMRWELQMADGIHATLAQLVARAPIYHLQCLPDQAAARLCAETVRKEKQCSE